MQAVLGRQKAPDSLVIKRLLKRSKDRENEITPTLNSMKLLTTYIHEI